MRRSLALLTSVAVLIPAVVLLPTATSSAKPRPVAPQVVHVALRAGVDAAALRGQGAASDAAATAGQQEEGGAGASSSKLVVLSSPREPGAFETVGVSWARETRSPPQLTVVVRTRSEGRWGDWTALAQEEDPQDPSVTRSGTEPLYAGASDAVQARVEAVAGRLPQDLRLDLVDPGDSDFDAAAGATPAGSAAAVAARPAILARAAWGADESRRKGTPTVMPEIRAGVLHHTAGVNGYTKAQVPKILRGDYAYHLSRGWNDIGYNFLVDRFGRTWEGRAGGIDRAVMGAHAGGFNSGTVGVSMIGNYDAVRPTAASLEAVARVFAWKLDLAHRNPRGTTRLTSAGGGTAKYPAGKTVTLPVIMGHRNVGSTACPGKYLYPQLPGIRARVAVLMKAGLLDPTTSAASVPQSSGSASLAATALTTQTWKLTVTPVCSSGGPVRVITGRVAGGRRFAATWDGRNGNGNRVRAGAYTLTLTSQSKAGAARPLTSSVLLTPPAPAPEPQGPTTTGTTGRYVPLIPGRLADTRSATSPLGPGGRLDVPVLGRGAIPASGVTSVVLNVTAACPSATTSLAVHPTGQTSGGVTAVNARGGVNRSELLTVPVGANGTVSVRNAAGVTDVIVDVVGYHASSGGAGFVPSSLARVLDTRSGAALAAGRARSIPLPTIAGVAAGDVTAVVANVTVYANGRSGYVSVVPDGAVRAATSTVNFARGQDTDNRAVIGVTGGRFALLSSVDAHVAVDVVGVWTTSGTGAAYTSLPVKRVLDTRSGAKLGAGGRRGVAVTGAGVPAGADAVLVNLAGLAPTARTALVTSAGDAPAKGYDLRLAAGDTRGNTAFVRPAADGTIAVTNSVGSTHVLLDVLGYYSQEG